VEDKRKKKKGKKKDERSAEQKTIRLLALLQTGTERGGKRKGKEGKRGGTGKRLSRLGKARFDWPALRKGKKKKKEEEGVAK